MKLKINKCAWITLLAGIFLLCGCARMQEKNIFAMDTVMNLKVYSDNDRAAEAAEKEIKRLDELFDRGNFRSDVYRINSQKSVEVAPETVKLIQAAVNVSERTDGALDITTAPLSELWGFRDENYRVPSESEISTALQDIGYDRISIDGLTVSVPENFMLDLGAVAKGYTSDSVIQILKANKITSAIVSLGGNVHALGEKPGGGKWSVGIANPHDRSRIIGSVDVKDKAVITSGRYQRFFESGGKRYHHIIDPKTGRSAESGLSSVTVIADCGAVADGLSTALFVSGLDKSICLWRESEDFEAVFIDDAGNVYVTEGAAEIFRSDDKYSVIKRSTD